MLLINLSGKVRPDSDTDLIDDEMLFARDEEP
jgi:hypothetical protein